MNAFTAGITVGLFVGILIGMVVSLIAVLWIARGKKLSAPKSSTVTRGGLAALLVVSALGMMFGKVHVILAQTATMVPLVIPINPVMSSTNDWMATFAPIAAIGIGMTLSLAVFGFLGKTIKSAFS